MARFVSSNLPRNAEALFTDDFPGEYVTNFLEKKGMMAKRTKLRLAVLAGIMEVLKDAETTAYQGWSGWNAVLKVRHLPTVPRDLDAETIRKNLDFLITVGMVKKCHARKVHSGKGTGRKYYRSDFSVTPPFPML